MFNRPVPKKHLAISFENHKDILAFIAKIRTQYNLANTDKHPLFHQQFIVATNGRTYLLDDILKLNEKEIAELKLEFLSNNGYITVPKIQQQALQNHKEFTLTNNRVLSNLFLNLYANPKSSLLYIDLPVCGIHKFPVIFPAITSSGYTYESESLQSLLTRRGNDPITHQPLHENDIVKNLSLQELIWVIYQIRFNFISKLVKVEDKNPEEAQGKRELISAVEEQKTQVKNHLQFQFDTARRMHDAFIKNETIIKAGLVVAKARPDLAAKSLAVLDMEARGLEDKHTMLTLPVNMDYLTLSLIAIGMFVTFIYSLITKPRDQWDAVKWAAENGLKDYDSIVVALQVLLPLFIFLYPVCEALWNFIQAIKVSNELKTRKTINRYKTLGEDECRQMLESADKMATLKKFSEKQGFELSALQANSIWHPPAPAPTANPPQGNIFLTWNQAFQIEATQPDWSNLEYLQQNQP